MHMPRICIAYVINANASCIKIFLKEINMALPINIEDLISHRHVESTRIEYKKGWNPETTLHSICAFANDIDNTGGGYIIIGVEEENGLPKLPVNGLKKSEIDAINKDIINKCNLIEPRYIPVIESTTYKGSDILVLWVYGGEFRPYKCPVRLNGEKSDKAYYIRKAASTIRANLNDERELIIMSHPIPFDDRPWNYPYAAIEEILTNSVYHKSYEIHEPIIVTSTPEKLEITSIPGPDRSISDADMKRYHMVSKTLRNRRIGDYLKELQLAEGRNTGIPSAVEAMIENGNDLPIFETDEDRTYLTVILPIHKSFLQTPVLITQPNEIVKLPKTRRSRKDTKKLILQLLMDGEISRTELAKRLGYTSQNRTLKAIIDELLDAGKLEYTEPDNKRNMFQKLRLSTDKA
jgi:predicted HTH transcriptional regulator